MALSSSPLCLSGIEVYYFVYVFVHKSLHHLGLDPTYSVTPTTPLSLTHLDGFHTCTPGLSLFQDISGKVSDVTSSEVLIWVPCLHQ